MITRTIGGGYIEAIFNIVQRDFETGKMVSVVERIFGIDEEELWDRIRSRFPKYRQNYRTYNRNNNNPKQPWRNRG